MAGVGGEGRPASPMFQASKCPQIPQAMVDYIDESIGHNVGLLFDLDAESWSKSVPSLQR